MRYTTQVEIGAPSQRVWSVLVDVERWPSWTPTVTALEVLGGEVLGGDDRGLRTGGRVRISQPGLSPSVYTVTELDEGHGFRWQARRFGIRQVAGHEVDAVDEQSSRVTLTFTIDGPLGWLVSPLAGATVRRMVDTEARALRDRVETGSTGQEQ